MKLSILYNLKRDLIQKIFSITIILLLFFLTIGKISTVNAQDDTPSRELTRLSKKFDLVDIDANEVPKGVVLLEFDSTQELEEFLTILEKNKISTSHKECHRINRSDVPLIPTGASYSVVTRGCSKTLFPGAVFNTWADILVGTSGSFTWISSVLNTRVGLTGSPLWMSLSNEYSYAYNQSQSSVSVKGGAIYNIYLIIEGHIKLVSGPVSCSFTYKTY